MGVDQLVGEVDVAESHDMNSEGFAHQKRPVAVRVPGPPAITAEAEAGADSESSDLVKSQRTRSFDRDPDSYGIRAVESCRAC